MVLFFFFKFKRIFIYLFIYFWLCWVFVSVQGLSLVVASGGHSSSRCTGLSLSPPVLLRSTGSRRAGSVIVAHGPSCFAAVESSRTRARTRVPCIGRQILNHCTTREALGVALGPNWVPGRVLDGDTKPGPCAPGTKHRIF